MPFRVSDNHHSQPLKIALMGSVSSSYTVLESLIRGGASVCAVLGLDESASAGVSDYRSLREPTKAAKIPFLSFRTVREQAVEMFLRQHRPDLLWVIGLSQMVPDSLIRIARDGGVGFHPTMLPQGRGRAPVAWTILNGARAAVSLFFLTHEPDAGDIIIQREVPVLPDDYSEDLIARTNEVLATCVLELCPLMQLGALPRTPQDHRLATNYPRRGPEDGLIDWSASTDAVYRLVRAAGRPYPGAFTRFAGTKITVWRGSPAPPDDVVALRKGASVGDVLRVDRKRGWLVATGDGGFWITEHEIENAEALKAIKTGAHFGQPAKSPSRKVAR